MEKDKKRVETFYELLTFAFVALKLLDVIHWSWVWVISPLYVGFLTMTLVYYVSARTE